jgi:hypothetical protein
VFALAGIASWIWFVFLLFLGKKKNNFQKSHTSVWHESIDPQWLKAFCYTWDWLRHGGLEQILKTQSSPPATCLNRSTTSYNYFCLSSRKCFSKINLGCRNILWKLCSLWMYTAITKWLDNQKGSEALSLFSEVNSAWKALP